MGILMQVNGYLSVYCSNSDCQLEERNLSSSKNIKDGIKKNHLNSELKYFKSLKEKFENESKIHSMFYPKATVNNRTPEAS